MSPVNFKKTLCRRVDFKGQGPLNGTNVRTLDLFLNLGTYLHVVDVY